VESLFTSKRVGLALSQNKIPNTLPAAFGFTSKEDEFVARPFKFVVVPFVRCPTLEEWATTAKKDPPFAMSTEDMLRCASELVFSLCVAHKSIGFAHLVFELHHLPNPLGSQGKPNLGGQFRGHSQVVVD
jgi:hypothetical protein